MKLIMECTEVQPSQGLGGVQKAEDVIFRPATGQDQKLTKGSLVNGQLRFHIDMPESFGIYKPGFRYEMRLNVLANSEQPEAVQEFLKEQEAC